MDIGETADRAGFSRSKLSRIESLDLNISGDDTDALCRALGVDDDEHNALVTLARQAKRRGWWQVYDGESLGVSTDLLELEDDCAELRAYNDTLIPGFLQTHAYACAVIRATSPTLDADEVERQAQVRLQRQARMRDRDVEQWLIVDEYALTRNVGGPSIMAEQVQALIDAAGTLGVSIQVLRQDLPGHVALGMPFKLMTLSDGARYTYVDALGGGLYLETPEQIDKQEYRWRVLAAQASPFDETTTLLGQVVETHNQRSPKHDRPRVLRMAKE